MIKKILQYLLAVLCLGYVIKFFGDNREVLGDLQELKGHSLVAIAVLMCVALLVQCLRYRIVIGKFSGKSIPYFGWLRIFVLGTFLNKMVPQSGNVFRSVRLKQQFGVSHTRYIGSYLGFMWIDTAVNLVCSLMVVVVFERQLKIASMDAWAIIVVLLVGVGAGPFVLNYVCRMLHGRISFLSWVENKVAEILAVTVTSASDFVYMSKVIGSGLVSFAITISTFYACFGGLGVDVSFSVLALFCVIMKLSNQLILTPGGNLGIREIAYGVLGRLAGVGMGEAMLASILIRIVGTILIFGLGGAFGGFGLLGKSKGDDGDTIESRAEQGK